MSAVGTVYLVNLLNYIVGIGDNLNNLSVKRDMNAGNMKTFYRGYLCFEFKSGSSMPTTFILIHCNGDYLAIIF